MAKKYEFLELNWEGDPPAMTKAIKRLKEAFLPVCRPSQHQLKIGSVNFWPSTGGVQIDGQSKQRTTGIDEVFRILEKSDPALKYLKKPKQITHESKNALVTIELDEAD